MILRPLQKQKLKADTNPPKRKPGRPKKPVMITTILYGKVDMNKMTKEEWEAEVNANSDYREAKRIKYSRDRKLKKLLDI